MIPCYDAQHHHSDITNIQHTKLNIGWVLSVEMLVPSKWPNMIPHYSGGGWSGSVRWRWWWCWWWCFLSYFLLICLACGEAAMFLPWQAGCCLPACQYWPRHGQDNISVRVSGVTSQPITRNEAMSWCLGLSWVLTGQNRQQSTVTSTQ